MKILDDAGLTLAAGELVLVTSASQVATTPAVRTTVSDMTGRLKATGQTTEVRDPYAAGLVSADHHSVLVQVTRTGDPLTAADRVQPMAEHPRSTEAQRRTRAPARST